jgi:hypothetical protein
MDSLAGLRQLRTCTAAIHASITRTPFGAVRHNPGYPTVDVPKLGFAFPNVFLFATADGAQYVGKRDFDDKTMRLAITRDDGMPLDIGKLMAAP